MPISSFLSCQRESVGLKAIFFNMAIFREEAYMLYRLPLFASLAVVASCAMAQTLSAANDTPDKLKPGNDASLVLIAAAKGVQIYECHAKKDGNGYDWAFVAPEAALFDGSGKAIGKHYAGPHWEALDGSKVVGTLKERVDAPGGNIPWLLLSTQSDGPAGAFSSVSSIQRLHTAGGAAPKDGCSKETVGTRARIGYTADYYFFATQTTAVPTSYY
jgi:hypothetical protein